ncbi:hypothetical protein [Massilia sp. SYSU DXS3249]
MASKKAYDDKNDHDHDHRPDKGEDCRDRPDHDDGKDRDKCEYREHYKYREYWKVRDCDDKGDKYDKYDKYDKDDRDHKKDREVHSHHIHELEKSIKTLADALATLGRGAHLLELQRIIHQPGWTSPAEFAFVNAILDHLSVEVRTIERLQADLVEASRKVKKDHH